MASPAAGIKDLRHGSLRHDDWNAHDPDLVGGDMLGESTDDPRSRLIGDGLVLSASAAGQHPHPSLCVPFAAVDTVLLSTLHHLRLVRDQRVHALIAPWLADAPSP